VYLLFVLVFNVLTELITWQEGHLTRAIHDGSCVGGVGDLV